MNLQNILSYRFSLKKNHRLDLMAGHEMVELQKSDDCLIQILSYGFYGERSVGYVELWRIPITYTTLGEPSFLHSYFGRLNYAKDRTFSLLQPVPTERMCSLLKTVGIFSGYGIGICISRKNLWSRRKTGWIILKLRVSYRSVGNARVNSYWDRIIKWNLLPIGNII